MNQGFDKQDNNQKERTLKINPLHNLHLYLN